MPIFDNNLESPLFDSNNRDHDYDMPNIPIYQRPDISFPGFAGPGTPSGKDDGGSPLFKNPVESTRMLPTVSALELYENRRYPGYSRDIIDIEDQFANKQGTINKAINGITKGTVLAGTTIAGSGGMIYGGIKSLFTGRFADIFDNEVMRGLDEVNRDIDENYLPNYQTNREKNAEWYSPNYWFTANFLFDNIIKNSGFAVGAMISGNIANSAISALGKGAGALSMAAATAAESSQAFKLFSPLLRNTARAFSVGKNLEVAQALEQGLSNVADITAASGRLSNILKTTNFYGKVNDIGRRSLVSLYSMGGESSFEGLQTMTEYRNSLINKYKETHGGLEPSGKDLEKINQDSDDVGKVSFLQNMALLSATEYTQLPYLMGSSYKNSKKIANSLLGKTDDVILSEGKYIPKAPTTKFGKIYKTATGIGKYVFDPKEGAQEIGQYAVQVGTQNYFRKAGESKDVDLLSDGLVYGLFGKNEEGEDVGALVSKEGITGGIVGALTGGLMQAKGRFKESRFVKTNTQNFINKLNDAPSFRDAYKYKLDSANRGVALQQQYEDAIISGDKLEAIDTKQDMLVNYLSARVKYGRFDMIMEDLDDFRAQGQTEEGLVSLKEQGYANLNDNVQTFQERVSGIQEAAKKLNSIYDTLNLRYGGETNEDGTRKYSDYVIDKLAYANYKINNYESRIPELNSSLLSKNIDVSSVLSNIDDKTTFNSEAVAEIVDDINSRNITDADKSDLKAEVKDIIELGLRRQRFIDDFNNIVKGPAKYDDFYDTDYFEQLEEVKVNVETPDGESKSVKLDVGEEYDIEDPIYISGGKIILNPKVKVLSAALDKELEVQLPDGETKFMPKESFAKLNITTNKKENAVVNGLAIDAIKKVLADDPNAKGLSDDELLDYVNILNDPKITYAINKEFNAAYEDYGKEQKLKEEKQKRLKKDKEAIAEEQDKLEQTSGTVPTVSEGNETPESKLKEASILFKSTTSESESEDWGDPVNSAPHVKRSRTFLNNVARFKNRKNYKVILVTPANAANAGLDGIVQLSYGKPLNTPISEIEGATSIDDGFMAQVYVYVDKSGSYFVDENGKKISKVGEQVPDMLTSGIVFQTMPAAKLYNSKGNARFRKNQEEEANKELAAYKIFREQKFADDSIGQAYPFKVSRGVRRKTETVEDNHIQDILGGDGSKNISSNPNLLEVVTAGKVEYNGELLSFPNGSVVFKYGNILDFANNKKLTPTQALNVYSVIEALANTIISQSEKGQRININNAYSKFLQNVLYWKSKSDTTSDSQIRINVEKMSINIGSKSFDIAKVSDSKEEMLEALKKAFLTVNNKTLKDGVTKSFVEYVANPNGKPTAIVWKNYQEYLLSNKYPNGKSRSVAETPLITHAPKPTELFPSPYVQRYSTIEEGALEFPYELVKEEVKEVPKKVEQGKYNLKPGVVNGFKLSDGRDILFTGEKTEDGYVITIQKNSTLDSLASDSTIVNSVRGNLESIGVSTSGMDNTNVIKEYLTTAIIQDIEKQTAGPVVETETEVVEKEEEAPAAPAEVVEKVEVVEEVSPEMSATQDDFYDVKVQKSAGSNYETLYVPRALYELAYNNDVVNQERSGGAQTLDTIIKRGGYTVEEFDSLLPNWREELGKLSSEKKIDFSNFKGTGKGKGKNTKFRRVGISDNARMTEEELEVFKKWHAENIPNIPFEILEQMIVTNDNRTAWGVFENGVAKFVRGGLKGTEYHEIFEGIWANLLTDTEKNNILSEFRSQKGEFTDRETGEEYSYSDPAVTDQMIKERIADDFSDYRLGKIKATSLKEKVRNFFKRIMDFFKSFIAKKTKEKSLKDQLFDAINKGELKERPNIGKSDIAPQYRIQGLSEQVVNDLVQDMVGTVAELIYGQEEYTKQLLFNPEQISGKGIFDEIKKGMEAEGIVDFIGEDRYNKVQERALEYLRTLGVSFDMENDINNEESNKNDYAPEVFSVDWKKTSTAAIRFSLATIPQRIQRNQKGALSLSFPEDADGNMFVLSNSLGEYGGYKLVDFNKVFATLLDKLSNTTGVEDFTRKLIELAETDTTYLAIFTRLGGDLSTKSFDFTTFKNYDWKYFVQFYTLFTKQKPEALIQYINNGETYIGSANLFSATKDVTDNWINNIKTLSKAEDSIVSYNKAQKLYKIDSEKIKAMPIRKTEEMVAFLEKVGIDFPLGVYKLLSNEEKIVGNKLTSQKDEFINAVKDIHRYLGKNNDLMTIKEDTLDISGPLRTLSRLYVTVTNPNQDSTYFGVDGQRIGSFAENNAPSLFEDDFNESDTLDELLEKRPELNGYFSKNSQVLKLGGLFFDEDGNRIAQIKVETIQGTKNLDTGKNKSIAKLTLGERFTQEINQNIQGKYYVLVPGDGSTEWMMNLGNVISFDEVQSKDYTKKLNNIFKGYLIDEVKLALYGDSKTLTVKDKAKELRFMKDVLSEKDVNNIEKLLTDDNTTLSDVENYINDNSASINSAIQEFISNINNKTLEQLVATGQINQINEDRYVLQNFDSEFINKNGLENSTREEVENFLTFINTNYIINNIEYHKFIFGDPYQFKIKKGNLDETKRIKAFLSPRRRLFNLTEFDVFLNDEYNKVGDVSLDDTDVTYHQFKDYTKTATLEDLKILGSIATSDLPESIKSQYDDVDETDAMSWIGDNTYREVKLKSGQWSDEAEAWHQWQMAWTRQNLPGYEYKSEALRKLDEEEVSKPVPPHHIEVIKPIVSGTKANTTDIDLVLDKFSQMPLYYSMVKGTNLEQLYLKMKKEGIGYVIAQSGRKVGSEGNNRIYNADGSFNTDEYSNTIDVSWKSYGIIVETASEGEKQQTRGSQLTKIISSDLFENGEAISPEADAAYKKNTKALKDLNTFAYTEFLNKLGVEDVGGNFIANDGKKISETLMYEMLRRDVSENVKDTIKTDQDYQFLIPFEASPSYEQIRSIIYSMVNKSLISPKMNGAPHVQVPATMFESGNRQLARKVDGKWQTVSKSQFDELSDDEKKEVVITDNSLSFYSKKNPYCEIMLPAWFKNQLKKGKLKNASDKELINYLEKTEEGKKILTGIGFRIPTQALSSVEKFRVKGFLPNYMGYTVVVPSEITKKAGSDFDIDKLNIYLKSVHTDSSGNLRLVEYKGSEQETFDFYRKMYDMISEKKAIVKSDMIEAIDIVLNNMDDPKGLVDRYGDYILSMRDRFSNVMDLRDELEKQLVEKTDEQFYSELKENYAKSMYKKSLENRYYESLEELMDIQGLERILSPIGDAGFEDVAKKLDKLRGYNEDSIKGRLLDRTYMTQLRHDFITGKTWVGIAAVNITGNSLRQKSQVYLDPERIPLIDAYDRKFVKNLDFALDVNKVNVNGKTYVSLSGLKTADGTNQYISDRFSGYATAFVDISANPYIAKIIKSDVIVSTFMFLEAVGAGNQGVMFLNQPIIDEYLKILASSGTKSVKIKANIDAVKDMFPANAKDVANVKIGPSNFEENIKEYYQNEKLSNVRNAEQQKILDEFIKYKILADQFFNFSQAINYDTTRFTSGDILYKKDTLFSQVRNKSVITNVEKVLEDTFIGDLRDLLGKSTNAIGAILKLDNPKIKAYTLSTLKRYATKPFMSSDDYEKIANSIRSAFLDYIIQTNSKLNNEIEPLLVNDDTNIAIKLQNMKAKYPTVQILQEFDVVAGDKEGGAKSIKLKANVRGDVFAENYYTGLMRELRDTNKELNKFYKDIVNTSILQGTSQTAISFRNIIPVEDYSKTITPIINQLQPGVSLNGFEQFLFERNNFANDNIFEAVSPGFVKDTTEVDNYNILMFIDVKGKARAIDRQVIKLSEKYNARQLGSDFVKLPRIIKTKAKFSDGEMHSIYVDVKTGNRIKAADFEAMKKSGDNSMNEQYYYAKVYTNEFNEFGERIPLRIVNPNAKDESEIFDQVYKLVNVYGDGIRAAEYPNADLPSVINNGSVKTNEELKDEEIVKALSSTSVKTFIGKTETNLPVTEEVVSEDIEQVGEIDVTKTEESSLENKENLLPLPSEEELGLNTDLNQDDFKC